MGRARGVGAGVFRVNIVPSYIQASGIIR